MKKLWAGVAAAVAMVAMLGGTAAAHSASVGCTSVSFSSFPSGTNTATVTVNGTAHAVNWTGASHTQSIAGWYTTSPVTIHVEWTADGGGSKDATLTCETPTTTTTTTTTLPPPTTTTGAPPPVVVVVPPTPVVVTPRLAG